MTDEKKTTTAEPEEGSTSGARDPSTTDPGGGPKAGRGGRPKVPEDAVRHLDEDEEDFEGAQRTWRRPPDSFSDPFSGE